MEAGELNKVAHVRVDGYTRVCLTAIAVLLTLVVVGLWTEAPAMVRPAQAVPPALPSASAFTPSPDNGVTPAGRLLPNPAVQREAMVAEQQKTNEKLGEILKALTGGKVKVVVISTDNTNEGAGDVVPPKTR